MGHRTPDLGTGWRVSRDPNPPPPRRARQILVSELALAEKTNEDKAEIILDEVLAS
jgi:hypothetical protein